VIDPQSTSRAGIGWHFVAAGVVVALAATAPASRQRFPTLDGDADGPRSRRLGVHRGRRAL